MLCQSKQARTIEQTYFVMKQHSMKPKRNQGRIQDFPGGGRQPEENWTAGGRGRRVQNFTMSIRHCKLLIIFHLSGLTEQLNVVYFIDFPPNQFWFSTLNTTILWMATLSSTLFILSMTFDRFYSIIRPHKAASFNTVKRAKITIVCIIIFSILVNIPHLFTTALEGRQSVPFGMGMDEILGQFYYWFSFVINFAFPFVSLLTMNTFIIHLLRQRSKSKTTQSRQHQSDSGKSETQIIVILLLVTFSFLILTTPAYAFFLFVMFVDYTKSPHRFAGFHLFYNIAHKLYYTNYGINFYLYVISGQKFRSDLIHLFRRRPAIMRDVSIDSDTKGSVIVNSSI